MKKILISMLALLCLTTACSKAENKPTPEPSSNPVISRIHEIIRILNLKDF